jgi:mono/diheme cytochrome c family protein
VAFLLTTGGSGAPVPAAKKEPAPTEALPEATSTEAKAEATSTQAKAEATPAEAAPAPAAEAEKEGAAVDVAAALKVIERVGCYACHMIPGAPKAATLVGPDLSHIGTEAASRKAGMSAEEYLRESILDPSAFIAPKCPAGPCPSPSIMPPVGSQMNEEDLDLVIAYLMALTGE